MEIKHPETFDVVARVDLAATTGCVLHVIAHNPANPNDVRLVPIRWIKLSDLKERFVSLLKERNAHRLTTSAQIVTVGTISASTGEVLLNESIRPTP